MAISEDLRQKLLSETKYYFQQGSQRTPESSDLVDPELQALLKKYKKPETASSSGDLEILDFPTSKTADVQNPEAQKDGFTSRLKEDISKRKENIQATVDRFSGEASIDPALKQQLEQRGMTDEIKDLAEPNAKKGKWGVLGSFLEIEGQLAGAVSDIFGQALNSVGRGVSAVTPDVVKDAAKSMVTVFLNSDEVKPALTALSAGMDAYDKFKTENPGAAAKLEAVVNIASLAPVGEGSLLGAKTVSREAAELGIKDVAKKAATETIEAGVKAADDKLFQEALTAIKPVLSKKEKQLALEAGRGKSSLIKGVTLEATSREREIANVVKDVIVDPKKPVENIAAIDNKIRVLAEETYQGLKNNDSIFNTNQLRSFLDQAKSDSSIVFGSDTALEGAYDSVVNEFLKLMEGKPKTISNLLEARKEFDQMVKQKFPRVFELGNATDNARANAILDVRRQANDFIESKLPEGNEFKKLLHEQSLLFEANKNIAKKTAGQVDVPLLKRVSNAIQATPLSTLGVVGGGLSIGALSGVLSSPLIIGSILTYGSYKLGKKVVTSKMVQTTLKSMITQLEKASTTAVKGVSKTYLPEVSALKELLQQFDENQ